MDILHRSLLEPDLGILRHCEGSMPHPDGLIAVKYHMDSAGRWSIAVDLPEKVTGSFVWKDRTYTLRPGINHFLVR